MSDVEDTKEALAILLQSPPLPSEKVNMHDIDETGSQFSSKSGSRSLFVDGIRINVDPNVPALAEGDVEARWSWLDLFRRKEKVADWNAIATRLSVFDDPNLAPHYTPR
jgi:hypothetical protein